MQREYKSIKTVRKHKPTTLNWLRFAQFLLCDCGITTLQHPFFNKLRYSEGLKINIRCLKVFVRECVEGKNKKEEKKDKPRESKM